MFRIDKAQWGDEECKWLRLEMTTLEKQKKFPEKFTYVIREASKARFDKSLWEQAMKNKTAILEDEATLILSGKKPLPKGYTIIGKKIFNDELQARMVRQAVLQQLAELGTAEAAARAEIDEDYANERNERIIELQKIITQEKFPYEINWAEEIEVTKKDCEYTNDFFN